MFNPSRPAAFLLLSTDHGTMIVNHNDWERTKEGDGAIGVGVDLFTYSSYDAAQLELLAKLLEMRRESFGDGVICIDGGANIGTYTLTLAKLMTGWGNVLAFEPQERVFYALAGNVVINNCRNARAINAALGSEPGSIEVPVYDDTKTHNFGGVTLRQEYAPDQPVSTVQLVKIDQMKLKRLDLLKLDIEGMEIEALFGARDTIERCKPILCIEHIICGQEAIERMLKPFGYHTQMTGMNVVCIHESDPVHQRINWHDPAKEAA